MGDVNHDKLRRNEEMERGEVNSTSNMAYSCIDSSN